MPNSFNSQDKAGFLANPTISKVASSASSITILASNTERKDFIIQNSSAHTLFLNLAGGEAHATTFDTGTNKGYTVALLQNDSFIGGRGCITGTITGIWASTDSGGAIVSEFKGA